MPRGNRQFTNAEVSKMRMEFRTRRRHITRIVWCTRVAAENGVSVRCIERMITGATYKEEEAQ